MSSEKKSGCDNLAFDQAKDDQIRNGDIHITVKAEPDRVQWGHGMEFLMSCIAMSVGLGNIWRFPFTAYENGGGAFLIPYIIVLIVIGRPLYYMEMVLGQFSSRGNVKMFETLSPALKGIGYGQLVGCLTVATYYCALMAITLFYLANSFTADLPWTECMEKWDNENLLKNITCVPSKENGNVSQMTNSLSSSELYFTREVLREKTQIGDGIGFPEWRLTTCLLIAWLATFLVSRSGVKSSGKAAYFLAVFPYVVMIALLIRAVTLEGAADGILYFIRPQWDKLAKAEVWYAAVTQCFFSLNVGFGTIIMYSSYNGFEHNINRDVMVVTTLDTFTSLLAGATIFGILGNLAYELNVDVNEVINSGGAGLAFISYPEAIAKFEQVPWLFAILFFVMLFVLGIGSLVALHGCAITVIKDAFPSLKSSHVSAGTAAIGFLVGLVYITPGGQFILNMVDFYGGTFIIFVFAVIEVYVVVCWYGVENLCLDVEYMLKQKVGVYFRIMWGFVMPALLLIIFLYFLVTITRLKNGPYEYPDSALVIGWLVVVATILQFLYWICSSLYKNGGSGFLQAVQKSFSGSYWRPSNDKLAQEWSKFKKEKSDIAQNDNWLQHKWRFYTGREKYL